MKWLSFLAIGLTASVPAFAQNVSIKDGNVQFTDTSGKTTALTSSGRDSAPVLAPDGKWVAFVRKVDGKKIATGSDEVEPTELWQVRIDGKLRGTTPAGEFDDQLAWIAMPILVSRLVAAGQLP